MPDCSDLRISSDHSGDIELDRLVEGCNTSTTVVHFRTQVAIPASSVDIQHWLHTGNPTAGSPPQDPANVYAFYDDFQDGDASGWNAAKGSWGVVSEGINSFYRYTGGGANWAISYVPLANIANLDYSSRIRASTNTNWIGLSFRIQDANNFLTFYQSRDDNYFKFGRVIGDKFSLRRNPAFSIPANTWYRIHIQAIGSAVRARIWQDGTPEPSTWLINYNETTFQTQSNLGATLYYHLTNADWDDFQARRLVVPEPTVALSSGQPPVLTLPEITNIQDNGPVSLGSQAQITANVSTTDGVINAVTLSITSPVAVDVPMSLVSGTNTNGIWQGSYSPSQSGNFNYQVRALGSNGSSKVSEQHTLTVLDTAAPTISLVSIIDQISQGSTQTLVVQVTDNSSISQVNLTTEGTVYLMTHIGNGQYRYSWQVNTLGTIPYSVQAVDMSNNTSTFNGSFTVIPSLTLPEITNIQDNGPVGLGSQALVTANVSTTDGAIDAVTLKITSPVAVDVPMSLVSGTNTNGIWQGLYSPLQIGNFNYQVSATGSNGGSNISEQHSFTVVDTVAPVISLVSIIDQISQRSTQTLVVQVTDNSPISQVNLTTEGAVHLMTYIGGGQYRYSWQVNTPGIIPFTVQAIDISNNSTTFDSSFTVVAFQSVEAGVCTWKDCKSGAASWSIDDSKSDCKADLETAGFRGTYYIMGGRTRPWIPEYSAAGHEMGSHTLGHLCNAPTCSPNCTPESLMAIPIDPVYVEYYRKKQLDANIQLIENQTGKPAISLAWPCGCVDPSRMEAAKYYFPGARGYFDSTANLYWVDDVNLPNPANLYNLNGASYYRKIFIDRAASEGKWAIITSHGSCDGIPYMGSQSDKLWLAPVGEVLKYIYVRDAAQFSNYNRTDPTISFDVVHNLSTFNRQTFLGAPLLPIIYDNPVTLKVHIQDTDSIHDVQVDGVSVPFAVQTLDGVKYVTFDATLLTSRHVVIQLD